MAQVEKREVCPLGALCSCSYLPWFLQRPDRAVTQDSDICLASITWREALGGRARKKKEKETEEEEVGLLEVCFYHIYEFLSPAVTRVPVVTSVGQDGDPVVPVNFVLINPIVFVHESSTISSKKLRPMTRIGQLGTSNTRALP